MAVTKPSRAIRRETAAEVFSAGSRRSVIFRYEPGSSVLWLKLKGERGWASLPLAWAFNRAMEFTHGGTRDQLRRRFGGKR